MRNEIIIEIIDKPFEGNPFKEIGKQVAAELDNKILNDIADVYAKYGFNLDKELFMEVVKEYSKRTKESE